MIRALIFSCLLAMLFPDVSLAKAATESKSIGFASLKNPSVQKLHQTQGRRLSAIRKMKEKGIVGESETGELVIRPQKTSKKLSRQVESLVARENQTRAQLVKKISELEKFNEAEQAILKKSFFKSYLESDPNGVYYYENKQWQKK